MHCRRWAVLYRGTFLVPVPSVLWKKKYRYRSAGTFTSQFLGGIRYFCKIFYYQKRRSLHNYSFHSNRLKDLLLKYNTAMPPNHYATLPIASFNTINHQLLLKKLHFRSGSCNNVLAWFDSYFSGESE